MTAHLTDRTIWCPCGLTHAHLGVPPYMTPEAAVALARRCQALESCPNCGEVPALVPASAEVST